MFTSKKREKLARLGERAKSPQGYPTIPRGLLASSTKHGEAYRASQREDIYELLSIRAFFLFVLVLPPCANGVELFGKGAYSKYHYDDHQFEESMSGSAGIAITLIKGVRLEGRYTRVQKYNNLSEIISIGDTAATLSSQTTKTLIYSVGLDIDLGGARSSFQPFVFFGAGMIQKSYTIRIVDPIVQNFSGQSGQRVSGNFGLGFRWLIGKVIALEIEGTAYTTDIDKPKPIIDAQITAGLRLFIG